MQKYLKSIVIFLSIATMLHLRIYDLINFVKKNVKKTGISLRAWIGNCKLNEKKVIILGGYSKSVLLVLNLLKLSLNQLKIDIM